MTEELFEAIVSITEEYLGPAAKRFMSRQIIYHLHKEPMDVNLEDLPKLVEWARITIALLTEDKGMVDEFARRLLSLADTGAEVTNGH